MKKDKIKDNDKVVNKDKDKDKSVDSSPFESTRREVSRLRYVSPPHDTPSHDTPTNETLSF